MNIQHRTLAKLPRGYSITVVPGTEVDGLPSFVAGSEGDDVLLYFESPGFRPVVIAREPGGYISLAPMELDGRRYVIAATKFKPGFDAATSDIRVYPLDRGEMPACAIVADLPYTHRVALLQRDGKKYVLASTLCTAKAGRDDWTQPGGILIAEVPAGFSIEKHAQAPEARWLMRYVFSGMNKNHGLDHAVLGARGNGAGTRDGYLVSAMEGLFFMEIPEDMGSAKPWAGERICASENSDAFACDWDDDGEPEIFSISPFHGNELAMHKRRVAHVSAGTAAAWTRTLIHADLSFGHIVWAGNFLGRPGLLAGSRRERRELRLYRPATDFDGGVDPNYTLIDEGIGPSQITVVERSPARMALYVAAHGVDEVRIYEVTE